MNNSRSQSTTCWRYRWFLDPYWFKERQTADRFKAQFLCSNDYFDNAIYRWLKVLSNISLCAGNLHRWILYRSRTADLVTPLISGIECITIVKDVEMTGNRQRPGFSKEYLNSDNRRLHFTFQKDGWSVSYFERQDLHELVKCAPPSVAPPSWKRATSETCSIHCLKIKGNWSTMDTRNIRWIPHQFQGQRCLGLLHWWWFIFRGFVRHCVISTTTARLSFFWPRVLF